MKRLTRGAAALGVVVTVFGVLGAPDAFAHEQRHVGAYLFTVGWEQEPTYIGDLNAVQLFIHGAHGAPLDDLGTPPTLQVEVVFGGVTSPPLDLEPSFDPDTGLGTHGEFNAPLIPTEVGNYTFHFFGSVNGQPVNQRFTSGPTTFNTVEDPSAIEFPTKVPTVPEIAALENRLTPRVASVESAAAASKSTADTAKTFGVLGLVLGGLGLIAGVVLGGGAFLVARRRSATRHDDRPTPVT